MPPRTLRRWSRSRGIDPEPYDAWRRSLAELPGRPPRVLAWAATADDGLVVLSPSLLSTTTASPVDWQHVGWHEIERGGWNVETAQLRWQTYAGTRGAVALPDPGRVPAVFRERVDASIAFERFVPLADGGDHGVVVSGRRNLADSGSPIDWHTTLTRGVTWRTPGVRELADSVLAEVRFEYDDR